MSGLVIQAGRVVTLVQRDGKQWVVALDSESGKPIWETSVAPAYRNGMGNGPRATPALDGNSVYVFTGEGILAALDFKQGEVLWSRDVMSDLNGQIADYGMACSPLVVGSRVIVTPGAPGAAVVAYDTQSGKLAWKSGGDAAGYSSPALLNLNGQSHLVAFTGESVLGLAAETGKPLWRYPFETNFHCNIATPLAVQGQVFVSAGENHGSVLVSLTARGSMFDVKEVWSSLGPQSVLRNEWQTSILAGDHLYGFDNVGAAGPVSHLTCIEAGTGKRKWQKLRFGKGNLIAADGKLLISTMAGELVVVRISPEGFDELGRTSVLGSTRQAPVLSNGRVYLRDDDEIVCVDLRAR